METVNANAAFLSNYEVMLILQELKDSTNKKNKREGSLATVTYETVHYLQETDCKYQTPELIQKFLEAMKEFKLTKMEKLMMVNNPPRTELEIQLVAWKESPLVKGLPIVALALINSVQYTHDFSCKQIVQESEERLSEEDVQKIINIVKEYLPSSQEL